MTTCQRRCGRDCYPWRFSPYDHFQPQVLGLTLLAVEIHVQIENDTLSYDWTTIGLLSNVMGNKINVTGK